MGALADPLVEYGCDGGAVDYRHRWREPGLHRDCGSRGATYGTAFELAATTPDMMELLWIAVIALLGGLILNVMPCVLPVLSIKVSSVLKHTDHDTTRVRFGFVAAAAGIMTFMWGLALILWALQTAGLSVGWGLQFQSPLFLR